jgi:hypothetical protein
MLAYYGPEWESLQSRILNRWCPSFTGATSLHLPDASGRNPGLLVGDRNTCWQSIDGGTALVFNGTSEYANARIQPIDLATDSVTVSFWNRNTTGTTGVYASLASSTNGTPFLIFQASGTAITLTHRNNSSGDAQAIGGTWQSANWRLLTGILTPTSLTLLINGIQVATTSRTAGATSLNQVTFAALNRAGSLSNYASSQIDDITLFRGALSIFDIKFIYEQGRGGGLLMQPPIRRSYYAQLAAAFSILAESGSYALTGQPIPLLYGRVLPADTGSVLLSGQTTPLLASRLLNADQGSYAYTGTDAATLLGRLLDAGAAAYTLDGTAAGFLASRRISADTVAYQASGLDVGFLRSRVLEAGPGQYVLVASPVNLQTGTPGTGGAAPYYYLFLLGGSR